MEKILLASLKLVTFFKLALHFVPLRLPSAQKENWYLSPVYTEFLPVKLLDWNQNCWFLYSMELKYALLTNLHDVASSTFGWLSELVKKHQTAKWAEYVLTALKTYFPWGTGRCKKRKKKGEKSQSSISLLFFKDLFWPHTPSLMLYLLHQLSAVLLRGTFSQFKSFMQRGGHIVGI